MDIYRSGGVAMIAALMGVEEGDEDAMDSRPRPGGIRRNCERAVVTAYRELTSRGNHDADSFRACTTLYRIHHPESSLNEARQLVAEWIDHHVIRQDFGPTPGCECRD